MVRVTLSLTRRAQRCRSRRELMNCTTTGLPDGDHDDAGNEIYPFFRLLLIFLTRGSLVRWFPLLENYYLIVFL